MVVEVIEGRRRGAAPTVIPLLPAALTLNLALNLERRRLPQRLVVPHRRVIAVEDAAKRLARDAGGPKGESRVRLGVEEFRDAHVGDVVVVVVVV